MNDMAPDAPVAPPLHRRPWTRSLLLGIVILVCGVAIGSVGTVFVQRQTDEGPGRRPGRGPDGIVEKMQAEFSLNPEQVSRLRAVLEEHWEKLSAIRAEVQPRVDAEYEELKRAVGKVLPPEQYKRWLQEFERRHHEWRARTAKPPTPREAP